MATTVMDDGYIIEKQRRKPLSKDTNAESFWADYDVIMRVLRMKEQNQKWGQAKICNQITGVSLQKVKKWLQLYFYEDGKLYRTSASTSQAHRPCVRKEELVNLIRKNHSTDHRKADAIYENLRRLVFPVVRETVVVLFRTEVNCEECKRAIDIPKTTRARRPIPATYPNSRWQIDLKKMPQCHGYNYVCNIVDCYSRFSFGKQIKTKTAKEVASVVISYIYMFGAPRILQSDNGKEFRNSDLANVVKEFETIQMHGRPYHPQSQGRVERFNRTMTEYFRVKLADDRNSVDKLAEFYYLYNNRVNKGTRPATPYQQFFKRPNFSAPLDDQVPYASLTPEEKEFLEMAPMDVEDRDESDTVSEAGDLQQNDADDAEADVVPEEADVTLEVHVVECTTPQHGDRGLIPDDTDLTVEVHVVACTTPQHGDRGVIPDDTNLPFEESLEEIDAATPMSMPTLSPAVPLTVRGDETEQLPVNTTSEEPIPITTHQPQFPLRPNPEQMAASSRDDVSPYYREIYRRRFLDTNSDETTCSAPKRRMVAPRDLYKSMYPLEQFSETNEGDEYYPELGEELFYRLNPALNKGKAYMTTGHWRRGVCRGRSFKSGVGHLYAVKDIITGTVYELNRYQIQRI